MAYFVSENTDVKQIYAKNVIVKMLNFFIVYIISNLGELFLEQI